MPRAATVRLLVAVGLFALVAACTGQESAPDRASQRDSDSPAPASVSLTVPRAVHKATALGDGRVLITGGCTLPGCEGFDRGQASEFFDPATGQFTAGPPMTTPRAGHTATLLRDGRVLLVGGYAGEGQPALSTTEVYDPAADEFIAVGELATGRADHSATVRSDGTVLIVGGTTGVRDVLDSTESFDPVSNEFSPGPSLPRGRSGQSAVETDGRLVLVGGTADQDTALGTTDILVNDTWSSGPALRVARLKLAATVLPDATVLVIGGGTTTEGRETLDSTEILDLDAGRSSPGPTLAEGQYKLEGAVATLPDGRIVITGGSLVEVFDPDTGELTVLRGPAAPRRSFISASTLSPNTVLIAGGYDSSIAPTADVRIVRIPSA